MPRRDGEAVSECGWHIRIDALNDPIFAFQQHLEVVEVHDVNGDLTAYLCVACDSQLPLNWDCRDCQWVEVTRLRSPHPEFALGRPCHRHKERA